INFTLAYSAADNTTIGALMLTSLICPSEVKAIPKPSGTSQYGIANYNWNVFGGLDSTLMSRGAFGANRSRTLAEFTDGLSNTVMASEIKTYQGVLTR